MTTEMEDLLATAERLASLGSWSMALPSLETRWSDGLFRIAGVEPGSEPASLQLLGELTHQEDRGRISMLVQRAIDDPQGFPHDGTEFELRLVRRDGVVRELRGHALTKRHDDGEWRFFGAVLDVTDQRMTERDLQARYAVSQALREWQSFEEGVVVLIRRLATALDFDCGALWTPDPSGECVQCRAFWYAPEEDLRAFGEQVRQGRFRRGEGVIGEVWEQQQPVLLPDLEHSATELGQLAASHGVRSLLAFPAVDGGGPVAIISLGCSDRRELSDSLLRTLTGIGHELGRFLYRRRAQLQPSPLSARELEVLRLAAEGNSGPEIASRLIVSPSTVKTHFENIYEKLGVSDRGGAVAHALRIGLIH